MLQKKRLSLFKQKKRLDLPLFRENKTVVKRTLTVALASSDDIPPSDSRMLTTAFCTSVAIACGGTQQDETEPPALSARPAHS